MPLQLKPDMIESMTASLYRQLENVEAYLVTDHGRVLARGKCDVDLRKDSIGVDLPTNIALYHHFGRDCETWIELWDGELLMTCCRDQFSPGLGRAVLTLSSDR